MSFVNGKWRQQLHLEPPEGWLNDPNGLSFFGGYYHVYFQYAPDNADGSGKKCWGHYRSRDMISWEFTGTVLFPDTPDDKDMFSTFSTRGMLRKRGSTIISPAAEERMLSTSPQRTA